MFELNHGNVVKHVDGVFVKFIGVGCSVQAGRDVVACFNEAMERLGLEMRVSALVCSAHSCYAFLLSHQFVADDVNNRLMILWEL